MTEWYFQFGFAPFSGILWDSHRSVVFYGYGDLLIVQDQFSLEVFRNKNSAPCVGPQLRGVVHRSAAWRYDLLRPTRPASKGGGGESRPRPRAEPASTQQCPCLPSRSSSSPLPFPIYARHSVPGGSSSPSVAFRPPLPSLIH